jgi:integrase
MSNRKSHVPAYRLHKPSGQARVIINREHVYLGKFGSPESHEKYARLLSERAANGFAVAASPRDSAASSSLFVSELILTYWRFAETYYVKDGQPTRELDNIRDALRPLHSLYGRTPASRFGPKSLKAVRQQMIDGGLSRGVINERIGRVKRLFKWAVAEELVPPSVHQGLEAVGGLRFGRTKARETEPVRPVPDLYVALVLPFVTPHVASMIKLQRLTGMRSCELVIMRPRDIDTSGEVWIYEPFDHKNRWRGHRKLIPLGPDAQQVIKPFLDRAAEAFLFSPAEADAWRLGNRPPYHGRERKTPVYPSELRRRERLRQARRKRQPKRRKGDRYTTNTYRRAVCYGFKQARKAGIQIPHWHPHQLRHTRATELRARYGVEAAQVMLGHARADVTQVYAERDMELARRIAKETG